MTKLRAPIARVLAMLARHPGCIEMSKPTVGRDGGVLLTATLQLELPFEWRAKGRSPNGVQVFEPVDLTFASDYPLSAPSIHLRQDFDRTLAHVQPGPPDEPPVPCIVDGSLEEFHSQRGLLAVIDQVLDWLESAAVDRLIDFKQGWEPVRRDSLNHVLTYDADLLQELVTPEGGNAFLELSYFEYRVGSKLFYAGAIGDGRIPIRRNQAWLGQAFKRDHHRGRAVAVIAWPGKEQSGNLIICEKYLPETVTDLKSLWEVASRYGCKRELQAGFRRLTNALSLFTTGPTVPLAVLLVARRPIPVINTSSDLEICPYLIALDIPELLSRETLSVDPAAHRHSVSPRLLQTLSGADVDSSPPWVLIGCGSLGSKVGLHMARAGMAPAKVVDKSRLSPHNAARHALIPPGDALSGSWLMTKATAFVQAVRGLGQEAEGIDGDIRDQISSTKAQRRFIPKDCQFVFNATASSVVREALAAAPRGGTLPRIIGGQLHARGLVGVLMIEGLDRNPDTGALISEAYELLRRGDGTRIVFDGALGWQEIGQGCNSATMVVSDSRISMFAAGMAEMLLRIQRDGMPKSGVVLIARVEEEGLSLVWNRHNVDPPTVFSPDGCHNWKIHVLPRAHLKIIEETARWPRSETGGIIVGRFSEATRAFYVTDALPAPQDSYRSANRFDLGVVGVRAELEMIRDTAGRSLYCLGTWHSHLSESGPSFQDQETATAQGLARLLPSVLLIRTPTRYRAILALPPDGVTNV